MQALRREPPSRSRCGVKLPNPREELAGCVWLPRILAKARFLQQGMLPEEYEARFCQPTGVDGHFVAYFGLSREDVLSAAALADSEIPEWFLSRTTSEQIQEWNRIAVNLGRPGFPMAERLPVALATVYNHIDSRGMTTVFEVLEADEADAPQ